MSPPRAAIVIGTASSASRSLPLRSNRSWLSTRIRTYRSPKPAPRTPAAPLPANRSVAPVSTPAGTSTVYAHWSTTRPSPTQFGHGDSMISPAPPHWGQIPVETICPRIERRTCRTWPAPPQVPQDSTDEPSTWPVASHGSHGRWVRTSTGCSDPSTASSKEMSMTTSRSSPRLGPVAPRVPPPKPPKGLLLPKKASKMSPKLAPSNGLPPGGTSPNRS